MFPLFIPTSIILSYIMTKNPSFRLCNIKKHYFLKFCKPQFSVVQYKKALFFEILQTPVFGCANPSFRLCKPQFSVVQTPVFGCANPSFRLCNKNRIAQPCVFEGCQNRSYLYLYLLLLRERVNK